MLTEVEVPLGSGDRLPAHAGARPPTEPALAVDFPRTCVYCGAPASAAYELPFSYSRRLGGERVATRLSIPYCEAHARVNARVLRIRRAAHVVLAVLLLAAVALMSVHGMWVRGWFAQVFWGTVVLAVIASLASPFIALVFAALSRLDPALRDTPRRRRSVLGFRASYDPRAHDVRFFFVNDAYAMAFMQANMAARRALYGEGVTASNGG